MSTLLERAKADKEAFAEQVARHNREEEERLQRTRQRNWQDVLQELIRTNFLAPDTELEMPEGKTSDTFTFQIDGLQFEVTKTRYDGVDEVVILVRDPEDTNKLIPRMLRVRYARDLLNLHNIAMRGW